MPETFQEQFILDLQKHLKDEVPEIRYIDENLGQWGDDNFRSAVSFPALLVDFPTTAYSQMSGAGDLAAGNVELTLLFSISSQSYNLAPDQVRQKALSYYAIEKKLVEALRTFEKEYFTPLVRSRANSRNKNELGLRIRELTFETEWMEYFDDGAESDSFDIAFTGQLG